MTIAVRQVSTPAISPSPTIGGRATSFASLPLPGSTIIVIGTWYIDSLTGSFAVVDNKSNSYSLVASAPETLVGDDIATQIWRTTAGIADPVSGTFTVTMTSPYSGQSLGNIVALEVTHDGDLITDRIVRAAAESATPSVGPSSTLSQANELIVAALIHGGYVPGNLGATRPATTGYTAALTVQDGDAGAHGFADYKIVSATTAVSAAWGTVNESAPWQAVLTTFYEDAGSGPVEAEGTGTFEVGLSVSQTGAGTVEATTQEATGTGDLSLEIVVSQTGTGVVANRKLLLTEAEGCELRDNDRAPVNLSGIVFEWYDKTTDTDGDPDVKGTFDTNESGEAIIPLFGSSLSAEQEGLLILEHPSDDTVRGVYRLAVH